MNVRRNYLSIGIALGLAFIERQVGGVPITWIFLSTFAFVPSMPLVPLLLSTLFVDICLGLPFGLTALVCGIASALKRVLPHRMPLRIGVLLVESLALAVLSHGNIILTSIVVIAFGIVQFGNPNVEEIGNAI